jgi:predicted Zn finger-like uncharacterized protein
MIVSCKSCDFQFQVEELLIKPFGSKVECSNCGQIFKVFKPNTVEKRKYQRIKTQNLISYFSLNKSGKMISQGLGIAMDISKGGILLQTADAIESSLISLAAIDREKNVFKISGRLAYSKKTTIGTYFSGIKFIGRDKHVIKFIVNLVKEYNYYGYNLFISWHYDGPPPIPHYVS